MNKLLSRLALALASGLLAASALAAEITVMSSGGFYSAMEELAPVFEKASGHKVILVSGSSMGTSPTAIPARMQRGEPADLIMLASTELDKLIGQGTGRQRQPRRSRPFEDRHGRPRRRAEA